MAISSRHLRFLQFGILILSSTVSADEVPIHGIPQFFSGKHRNYEYFGSTPNELKARENEIQRWKDEDNKKAAQWRNQPIRIERRADNIVALGPDCDQLKNAAELIGAWKKNLSPEWKASALRECRYDLEEKRFELAITDWVPAHVKKHLGKSNLCGGFNCVNTALGASGLVDGTHYSGQTEYETFMGSDLCRRIEDTDQIRPGDIVTIGSNPDKRVRPSHSFIYVSSTLAYEKPDYDTRPARFFSPKLIMENWNVAPACFPNGIEKPECSEGRQRWAVVHRCKAKEIAIPEILTPFYSKANRLSALTESWLRTELPASPEHFQRSSAEARLLLAEFKALMASQNMEKKTAVDKLAWQVMLAKVNGVEAQHFFTERYAAWKWFKVTALDRPLPEVFQLVRDYEKRAKELDLQIGEARDPLISMLAIRALDNSDKDLPIMLSELHGDLGGHVKKALQIAIELEPKHMRTALGPYLQKHPEIARLLNKILP